MTPKYGVGTTWTDVGTTVGTITKVEVDKYAVKWDSINIEFFYDFDYLENYIDQCIEAGLSHSLKPYLEVGKAYWSKKKDSSACFWRKYFGDDKWGVSEDTKEWAEAHTEPFSKNTGQITVVFSESPEVPAKKKPRCLNPA